MQDVVFVLYSGERACQDNEDVHDLTTDRQLKEVIWVLVWASIN